MKAQERYIVDYVRDEDGWWVATARGVKGCHTQGRTIDAARTRIREALSLFIGAKALRVALVDAVALPASARRVLARHHRARERLASIVSEAHHESLEAVRVLAEAGLSLTDAGELLGLSRQRVHQLQRSAGGPL